MNLFGFSQTENSILYPDLTPLTLDVNALQTLEIQGKSS